MSEQSGKLVEVNNLSVSFVRKKTVIQAVRGVSFSVDREGESLGIVGESGSGKSVSVKALLRLIEEPPGKINADVMRIGSKDVLSLRKQQLHSVRGGEVGMVFQEPMTSFDPVFTIGKQITEAITLHQNVPQRDARQIALDMLERVEMPGPDEVLGCYPHELSGGMRQRAMIAMALSCRPRVLIADEPTTALDVTVQAQVLELIKELQDEFGMALVMITHDLGVIAETVDRVVVMYGGKVLETGSVEEIFHETAQPYTEALLRSIPSVGQERGDKLFVIEGSSPNPEYPPMGCPFHPRCPVAMDICSKEFPDPTEVSESHTTFCWRHANG
jgi:oligopeptide/dipeptide ABC transporter ATP-binding protein